MQSVKPTNETEKRVIKHIQKHLNAQEDGILGAMSVLEIALDYNVSLPVSWSTWDGHHLIVANDISPFASHKQSCSKYSNSMLGSFTYPRATTPCSILYNSRSKEHYNSACHAYMNKPETVLYKVNGVVNVKRCMYLTELPSNCQWAVGGMGLLDMYNPSAEGFTGQYADVLRKTNHNVLALKNHRLWGFYFKDLTGQEINDYLKKLGMEHAILLDGGGLAAMNSAEFQVNTKAAQGYIIQFV